jgi:hypothetical protein
MSFYKRIFLLCLILFFLRDTSAQELVLGPVNIPLEPTSKILYVLYIKNAEFEIAHIKVQETEENNSRTNTVNIPKISHLNIIDGINKYYGGYDEILGVGEIIFENAEVLELNNRTSVLFLMGKDVKSLRMSISTCGELNLTDKTKIIDYDELCKTDDYLAAKELYNIILNRFYLDINGTKHVDYGKLLSYLNELSSERELVVEIMDFFKSIDRRGLASTISSDDYNKKMPELVNNLKMLLKKDHSIDHEEGIKRALVDYLGEKYEPGNTYDIDKLIERALINFTSKSKTEAKDYELFLGRKKLLNFLIHRVEDSPDAKVQVERLFQVMAIKCILLHSSGVFDGPSSYIRAGLDDIMFEYERSLKELKYRVDLRLVKLGLLKIK